MVSCGVLVLTPPGGEPAVAVAASRAGASGVLDVVGHVGAPVTPALVQLEKYGRGSTGVRCRLSEASALSALLERPGAALDVLVMQVGSPVDVASAHESDLAVLGRMHDLVPQVLAEVTSVLDAVAAAAAGADGLVLRGNESGGWVSDDSSFLLLQRVLGEGLNIPVWSCGGVGLHSAAGCIAAGAAGVVLDSQVWLTRESAVPPTARSLLAGMDGSETVCLGTELGRTLRVLDVRGSRGVKHLRELEERLLSEPDRAAALAAWSQEADARCGLDPAAGQVLPVGQDAAFAAALADTWVTVGGVVSAIRDAVDRHLEAAASAGPLGEGAPLAGVHGTRYPIVQGPMTRVSDRADFANRVAEEGALPFLALALMDGPQVNALLEQTRTVLGEHPWGVGILGFVPDDLRDEQLAAIRAHCPPYALIAGGRPDQALELEAAGTATYLHVPSPGLLSLFAEQGARRFVLEGRECGGHVGPRSSLVLWNQLLDVLARSVPEDELSDCSVLLAGGIHDARSAAAAAAVGAELAAQGMKLGVLLGTGYLFTEEAVQTGAITREFQRAALACDETVLLQTGPGHATRCARTLYAEDFRTTRHELVEAGNSLDDVRATLEDLNLGRLRIAAKALRRDGAHLVQVDDEEQRSSGMFMLGQAATARGATTTLAALHREVSAGGQRRLDEVAATHARAAAECRPTPECERIALVGMSCLLPKASDLDRYWTNVLTGVDAIGEVPEDRWDWHRYFDPDPGARDRTPSRWGGFLDPVLFDPLEYGIPPTSLPSVEPLQLLTLHAVRAALADAGYQRRPLPRERVSVVLGVGGGIADLGQQYAVRSGLPQVLDDVPPEALARLPEWTEDSFAGILLNVAAGRVANQFDFGGVNFTVDAACASSLAALHLGARELQAGSSDVVIVGGADTVQNPFGYLCFAATHALSPTGRCRTFDASADGIVISEGVAVVVLKRLADAERDGDRIYAVLDGSAGSSDGRALGLTAPRPEGQRMAVERAYAAAGVDASEIGLVEAHGTGTVVGDDAELRTLVGIFSESGAAPGSTVIGSVKSMIGHTKCTAGMAGVIKAALALHHRVLPPTLHVRTPNAQLARADSPFRLAVRPQPWLATYGRPRRASVSSFGFGGTNFHAVLTEYDDHLLSAGPAALAEWSAEMLMWSGPDVDTIRERIDRLDDALADGATPSLRHLAEATCRDAHVVDGPVLAVVAESLADLRIKLGIARTALDGSEIVVTDDRGVYLGGHPAAGRVAFVFPGQGSQYPGMLEELALHFPEVRDRLEEADQVLADRMFGDGQRLSDIVLPGAAFTPEVRQAQTATLTHTAVAQPALGAVGLGVHRLMDELGVKPHLLAGHSYGEWVALSAAGAFSEHSLYRLSEVRGREMARACPPGTGAMAAVPAGAAEVGAVLDGLDGVWLANLNSPRQTVISGATESVEAAVQRLAQSGLDATLLNVSSAFHSPLVASATAPLRDALASEQVGTPDLPVFAGATGRTYGTDVRDELVHQLTEPVLFAEVVEALYATGARIFVEAGPRRVLTGLVQQTLGDRAHLAVAIDGESGGLVGLLHTLARLATAGVPIRTERLFTGRVEAPLRLDDLVPHTVPSPPSPTAWWVSGGRSRPVRETPRTSPAPAPEVTPAPPDMPEPATPSIITTGDVPAPTPSPPGGSTVTISQPEYGADRIMTAHQHLMARFMDVQEHVMLAYLHGDGALDTDAPWAPEPRTVLDQEPLALPAPTVMSEPTAPPTPSPTPMTTAAAERPWAPAPEPPPTSNGAQWTAGNGAGATAPATDSAALGAVLAGIISDRTGYPLEILGPDTDLQSELGIDSIKKVEILGMFQRQYGLGTAGRPSAMQELAKSKTPQHAVDVVAALLAQPGSDGTAVSDPLSKGNVNPTSPEPPPAVHDAQPARFLPVAEAAP